MEVREMVIIILQITSVISKRRIKMKENSIENVLYYKDCKHKPKTEPPVLRTVQQPQECKMCCTMCCGEKCVENNCNQAERSGQMNLPPAAPAAPLLPVPSRKSAQQPLPPTRRNFNTREYIKNLISHDGDIRTILKDLVRVTIQKVALMKKMEMGDKEETTEEAEREKDYEPDL